MYWLPPSKRYRAGLTLTEVAIVMLVMGIILVGLWVAVDAVYRNSRVVTTNKQLMEVVSRLRSLYGLSRSTVLDPVVTGTSGASLLAQIGAVPKDMINNSTSPVSVVHMWGGPVTVDAVHTVVAGDSFRIGLTDVPASSCVDLLLRMTGARRDPGLISAGTSTGLQTAAQMPIGLSTAVDDCAGVLNALQFTFMLKS